MVSPSHAERRRGARPRLRQTEALQQQGLPPNQRRGRALSVQLLQGHRVPEPAQLRCTYHLQIALMTVPNRVCCFFYGSMTGRHRPVDPEDCPALSAVAPAVRV